MEVDGEGGRGGGVDNAKNGLSRITLIHLGARDGNGVAAPLPLGSAIVMAINICVEAALAFHSWVFSNCTVE